jgi:hypothetical protein
MAQFLLKQLGLDFWVPSYAERLRERASDPECRRLAEELIAGMTVKGSPWFWKEPYLSVTLPFWKEAWSNAVYIIPIRDPYDSAVSWQKLSIPRELQDLVGIVHTTLLEWHHFMLRILEETDTSRKLFISYEELVERPYEQCVRLADFLESHYGEEGLSEDRLARTIDAVDAKLQRTRGGTPFTDRAEATLEQKALYEHLLQRIEAPDLAFDPAAYAIFPGWRECLANLRFLRQLYYHVSKLR